MLLTKSKAGNQLPGNHQKLLILKKDKQNILTLITH